MAICPLCLMAAWWSPAKVGRRPALALLRYDMPQMAQNNGSGWKMPVMRTPVAMMWSLMRTDTTYDIPKPKNYVKFKKEQQTQQPDTVQTQNAFKRFFNFFG